MKPDRLTGEDAAGFVEAFAELERLAVAGKTMAARLVERSMLWRQEGYRTAAHWVSQVTAVPVGRAVGTLETARRLEALPATAEAFCAGELSEPQVTEVAAAASAAPGAESELLEAARSETVGGLRRRCRQIRASSTDPEAAYRRVHQGRYLRHWTDGEGAFRFEARMTVDDGARVLAGLEPHRRRIAAEARHTGRKESREAFGADALVAMASAGTGRGTGAGSAGARAMVHVRVDHAALARGHTEGGEVCEIPGVGPIPVSVARAMASDSILKAFLTKDADVVAVAHLGRTIPARLRTALEVRDPICVAPDCDISEGLEIDHTVPVHERGPTSLDNLARLCRHHHYLKTYQGYRLGGRPGAWTWSGPDPPPE